MLALAKNYDKALEDEEKMTPGKRAFINDVTHLERWGFAVLS